MSVKIDAENGMLVFRAPYDQGAVNALKTQIPGTDRKWDGARKIWLVTPTWGTVLQNLALAFYNEVVSVPAVRVLNTAPAIQILNVRYLGRPKERGAGVVSSFAWVNNGWNAVFSMTAMQEWFGHESRPGEAATLYSTLGVQQGADLTSIKTAWKRLARQWHPDTCREPDAADQFRAIKAAYDILGDDLKRARYDAGLKLEQSLRQNPRVTVGDFDMTAVMSSGLMWTPPLRCGLVMAQGQETLGRFNVAKILEWQDITRADGAILVSSWPNGVDMFVENWVQP